MWCQRNATWVQKNVTDSSKKRQRPRGSQYTQEAVTSAETILMQILWFHRMHSRVLLHVTSPQAVPTMVVLLCLPHSQQPCQKFFCVFQDKKLRRNKIYPTCLSLKQGLSHLRWQPHTRLKNVNRSSMLISSTFLILSRQCAMQGLTYRTPFRLQSDSRLNRPVPENRVSWGRDSHIQC